jgi:heme-binding NEAT domain protein
MSKKITEIPFWGVLVDCFPSLEEKIKTMQESEITNSQWLAIARWWRNALLTESDWSQVSDNSLTEEKKAEWRQYRKTLRELTDTYENPKDIVFPDLPA